MIYPFSLCWCYSQSGPDVAYQGVCPRRGHHCGRLRLRTVPGAVCLCACCVPCGTLRLPVPSLSFYMGRPPYQNRGTPTELMYGGNQEGTFSSEPQAAKCKVKCAIGLLASSVVPGTDRACWGQQECVEGEYQSTTGQVCNVTCGTDHMSHHICCGMCGTELGRGSSRPGVTHAKRARTRTAPRSRTVSCLIMLLMLSAMRVTEATVFSGERCGAGTFGEWTQVVRDVHWMLAETRD